MLHLQNLLQPRQLAHNELLFEFDRSILAEKWFFASDFAQAIPERRGVLEERRQFPDIPGRRSQPQHSPQPADAFLATEKHLDAAVVAREIQEYRAEKALEALKKMVSPHIIVIRNGVEANIESKTLVPGDIILLEAGSCVPADARLIEAVNLQLDEAALTGESTPVRKNLEPLPENTLLGNRKNMIFMGTVVSAGRAVAVITGTGMQTEFGKIAGLVQAVEEEAPPIVQKVEVMGRQLGTISIVCTILTFLVGYFIFKQPLDQIFITSIGLAVSAIPEGRPAVLTITLARSAC